MAAGSHREPHEQEGVNQDGSPSRPDNHELGSRVLGQFGETIRKHLARRFRRLGDDDIRYALLVAYGKFGDTYDPSKASPRTWFTLLAKRAAIDRLRKQLAQPTEHPTKEVHVHAGDPDPHDQIVGDELMQMILNAMKELSPLETFVIKADLDEGGTASAQKLAEERGLPITAIYNARARARKKMREALGDYFGDRES